MYASDASFDKIYPKDIQQLGLGHWTPIEIAKTAAQFLATKNGAAILDIGSGVGKFCLVAAHYNPTINFYGIEQRVNLVEVAKKAQLKLQLHNLHFETGNFTTLNFAKYDHFYFYNSFYENIAETFKIDYEIAYSPHLYNSYNRHLYKKLMLCPSGTRIACYHGDNYHMPNNYILAASCHNDLLKLWIKE
jgi:SAM-dependent methyltransferase